MLINRDPELCSMANEWAGRIEGVSWPAMAKTKVNYSILMDIHYRQFLAASIKVQEE